jgi:hypothetical protein
MTISTAAATTAIVKRSLKIKSDSKAPTKGAVEK